MFLKMVACKMAFFNNSYAELDVEASSTPSNQTIYFQSNSPFSIKIGT